MRSRRLVEILVTAVGADGVGYRELATVVRELVLTGQLLVGDVLPSERTLAAELGCSRTTVTAALALLRAQGLVVSRQGSGSVIAHSLWEAMAEEAREAGRPQRGHPHEPDDEDDVVNLVTAAPEAPSALPELTAAAVDRLTAYAGWHGQNEYGLPELRAAIARHLTSRDLPTRPENVLVTQGAVQGWNLVLGAYATPGTAVGVEQPTLPHLHDAAVRAGGRVVPVGVDREGWHLRRDVPDVLLATADHHNPTGIDQDDPARRALVRSLPSSSLLVVDTALTGLDATAGRVPRRPLALLRPDAVVLGSLSKTVWGGLRVGWVRASASTVSRLAGQRLMTDLSAPVLEQLIAVEGLRRFDDLLGEQRRRSRSRLVHLRRTLAAAGWASEAPDGGHCLWLDLGRDGSASELSRSARSTERLWITAGSSYSLTGTHDRWLRLPFCQPEPVLTEAVRRMVRAADRIGPAGGRGSPEPVRSPAELRQAGQVA